MPVATWQAQLQAQAGAGRGVGMAGAPCVELGGEALSSNLVYFTVEGAGASPAVAPPCMAPSCRWRASLAPPAAAQAFRGRPAGRPAGGGGDAGAVWRDRLRAERRSTRCGAGLGPGQLRAAAECMSPAVTGMLFVPRGGTARSGQPIRYG